MNTYAQENPFCDFNDAKIFERGTYIGNGDYDLEIKTCKLIETQEVGTAYIVEFEVLAVQSGDAHAVGDTVTLFQSLTKKSVAASVILGFAVAALGIRSTEKEKIEKVKPLLRDIMFASTRDEKVNKAPGRCLDGKKLHVHAYPHISKEGNEYTRHNWSPLA